MGRRLATRQGRPSRPGTLLCHARLVSQFAPVLVAELDLCVVMAMHAKTLVRKASSPAQWVFGRSPKLPASLMSDGGNIESCRLTSDSERLQHIEAVRTQAMIEHHRFEANQSLRAPSYERFDHTEVLSKSARRSPTTGPGTLSMVKEPWKVIAKASYLPSTLPPAATFGWLRSSRGRVVQAAREPCIPVHGENDWWSPDQLDLDLLKNSDQDLSVQHAPAFRAPPVFQLYHHKPATELFYVTWRKSRMPVPFSNFNNVTVLLLHYLYWMLRVNQLKDLFQ